MGNGPSLNNVNIDDLRDIDTFSVNRAYISYDTWGFKPTYYVIHDSLVIEHVQKDLINLVNNDTEIKKFFINNDNGFDFTEIESDSRVTFFTGFKNDKNTWSIPNRDEIDSIRVVPNKDTKIPNIFTKESNFVIMSSVVPFTIQLAIYMGYTDIGLVGVDARYVKREDVSVVDNKTIFTSDNDPNHYVNGYHGNGHLAADKYLHEVVGNSLKPYNSINDYCKKIGVNLTSCTINSRVNTFINYNNLENFLK
jgi:hypothetical protein